MRLHHHPLSPFSRKAYAAMLHRGDRADFTTIQLGTNALASAEYLKISPFGKMPALETDDEGPIFESTSIIEYLEERGPRVLLPAGRERIARHYDRVGDLYLIAPVAALWWEPESETGKSAAATAQTAWGYFSERLRDRAFVAGEAFSLGDLGAAIATDYFERLGVRAPDPIRAWRERCFALPAMSQALREAMPFIERMMPKRGGQS